MNRFNFLKKRNPGGDSLQQEKLVERYFDDLQLTGEPSAANAAPFDGDSVHLRINTAIDQLDRKKTSYKKQWAVASSLLILVSLSAVGYRYRNNILDVIDPIAMKQLTAVNGQVVNYTLADGTKLWLNSGSKLTYPERFRGSSREITLQGEAFLEVAHKSDQTFIVHTGSINTQVLGTSFNVKAYPEDAFIQVDVVTGKVGVLSAMANAKNKATVFLTPNQQVRVDKRSNHFLAVENVDVTLAAGWKDGSLIFKNTALKEVLITLHRRFNVDINADDNLVNCAISANFTNVSLPHIMEIISKLIKGKATPDGKGYRLRGKGC